MDETLGTGSQLIVVKQLPVIEDQLRSVKSSVEERVNYALSLVCTPETYKTVKAERSDLNKWFTELETARKKVKSMVLGPYEAFELVYKECVADIFKSADAELKEKIKSVEDEMKNEKESALKEFYTEYAGSIGLTDISIAPFEKVGIKIGLSDSLKSLRDKAKAHLDRVESDIEVINTQPYREEIMTEYRISQDLASAMMIVNKRHEAIEEEKKRIEAMETAREAITDTEETVEEIVNAEAEEELTAPVSMPDPEESEKIYETSFKVRGTLPMLKALKQFLIDGGYEYGSISDKQ